MKDIKALPALLIWAIAIIGNVIGWVVIGNNANERYTLPVFATCILACALAGYITGGKNWKFTGWAAAFGAVLALLLTQAV